MRRAAALLAILLTSCASSSDLIDTETVLCSEMGNEVSVMLSRANVESSPTSSMVVMEPQVTIDVEVSNNSDREIVVKSIVLVPRNDPRSLFRMNNAYGTFDQAIAEGKDHVFTLRTTGRWQRSINDLGERPSGSVEVETRVKLENGQIYRCGFSLPVA